MFKKLLAVTAIALVSQSALANIVLHPLNPNADACSTLDGNWAGSGTVKAGFISCVYNGTAVVTKTQLLDKTNYTVDVDLKLASGLCPDEEKITLPGSCENNSLVLDTSDPEAHMEGTVDEKGKSADMNGYVYVTVAGQRVKADIDDLHLDKKSLNK